MLLFKRILQRLAIRFRTPSALRQIAVFLAIGVALALLFSGKLQAQISAAQGPAPIAAEPPAVVAQAGTPEAEIQRVILRGNQQQEGAVATGNNLLMKDTSTDDYYQEMVKINDSMRANGIKTVKLTTIEWGEISINGDSARATTWETWLTDLPDGSTDKSRDRNIYVLTRTPSGWRMSSNEHPDSGPQLPNFFGR